MNEGFAVEIELGLMELKLTIRKSAREPAGR